MMHEIAFGRHEQRKEVPPPPRGVDCRAVVVLKAPLLHLKTDTGKGGRRRIGTVVWPCFWCCYYWLYIHYLPGSYSDSDWFYEGERLDGVGGVAHGASRFCLATHSNNNNRSFVGYDWDDRPTSEAKVWLMLLRRISSSLSLSLSSVAVFWLRSMCGFDFFICNKSAESISNSNRQSTKCLQLLQREWWRREEERRRNWLDIEIICFTICRSKQKTQTGGGVGGE